MAYKDKTKERSATKERVRRYRERKKQGLTIKTSGDSVTVEAVRTDVAITLPPTEGVPTKEPLHLRLVYAHGRWLKILS